MVFLLLLLALEITLGGHDILLIGSVGFRVVIVATGHDCDPSGVLLFPLLATIRAFLSAFAGGFGWCCPAAAEDHFPIAQNKDDPGRLLARGVPGGDIKQLLGIVQPAPWRLCQGLTCAGPEC
jgi:hypothetical protein